MVVSLPSLLSLPSIKDLRLLESSLYHLFGLAQVKTFFFLPPSSIHFTTHPYSPSYLILAHIHSISETYLTRGRNVQALKIALTIASEYDPRSGSKFKFKSLSPFSSYLNQTQYLPGSVFQFGYTTIFGWYASFIHLRTGQSSSLTIQAHSSLLIIISLSHSRISLGSHSLS